MRLHHPIRGPRTLLTRRPWTRLRPGPMVLRFGTAAVGLPVLAGAVLLGGVWFSALAAAAAAVGAAEISRMAANRGRSPAAPLAAAWAAVLVGAGHLLAVGESMALVAAGVGGLWAVAGCVWALARLRSKDGMPDWALTAAAAVVTGGPLSHAPLIRELADGAEWVFVALLVTFAADSGALFVGKAVGRRPFAPTVSPSKTWEGAAGGFISAVAASVGLKYAFDLAVGPAEAAALGALMGVAAILGDLAGSRLKRVAGVKDSGSLLPGHGGMIDRVDSIVPNLMLVYYFLIWAVQ